MSDACGVAPTDHSPFFAFDLRFLLPKVGDVIRRQPCSPTKRTDSAILRQIQQLPSYKTFTQSCQAQTFVQGQKSTLERLPTELQLKIMQQVPSTAALQALSLSSRTLNDAFLMHKYAILPPVLMREMGEDTFDEAFWALKAYTAEINTANHAIKLNEFLSEWYDYEPRSLNLGNINFMDIMKISRLYRDVLALVKDFCVHAMAPSLKHPEEDASEPAISESELARITRAFYRFELYYNLYRDPPIVSSVDRCPPDTRVAQAQSYALFGAWDAWEVEEIVCVRDYLESRLSKVFANIQEEATSSPLPIHIFPPWEERPKDLPEGAIALCESLVPPWYDETAPSGATFLPDDPDTRQLKNKFLAQGLPFLTRLIMTESSKVQYTMFRSIMEDWGDLHPAIGDALEQTPREMRSVSETMESFCHGDPEPFERDNPPSGPNFAWTWSNGGKFQPYYAMQRTAYLRRLGYVMWDKERLLRHPLFQKPALRAPDRSDLRWQGYLATADHEANCMRLTQHIDVIAPVSNSHDDTELIIPDEPECMTEENPLASKVDSYDSLDSQIAVEDDFEEPI